MTVSKTGQACTRKTKQFHLYCAALFLVSFIVRSVLSFKIRSASVYFDELFYLELAQNIWLRGSFSVYHLSVNFTKILYPLLLAPFYAIHDSAARILAISVFNSFLISSAIIPGYLISKRMLSNQRLIQVALLVLAASSSFCFSATFMAENLYFPLTLWVAFFSLRVFTDQRIWSGIAAGFGCFLLYLTKEVGAALFGACFLAMLLFPRRRKEYWMAVAGFAFSAIVPSVISHILLFKDIPYSYSTQVSYGIISSFHDLVVFLGYSISVLSWFLLSCFLLPVSIPLCRIRRFSKPKQMLLTMASFYVILISLGIGFGISPYESKEQFPGLLIHLRYYISVSFLFLLLFLSSEEDEHATMWKKKEIAVSMVALTAMLLPLFSPNLLWPLESMSLQYLFVPGMVDFQPKIIAILIPIILIVLVLFLFRHNYKKMPGKAVLSFVLCTEILSNVSVYNYTEREQHIPDSIHMQEIVALDRFLDTLDGPILLIEDDLFSSEMKTVNTFLNDDYYVVSSSALSELIADADDPGIIPLHSLTLQNPLYPFMPSEIYSAEQVFYTVNFSRRVYPSMDYGRDITPEGITCCRITEASDPSALSFRELGSYDLGTIICFSEKHPESMNYTISGFSQPESSFIWTEGVEAVLQIKPAIESLHEKGTKQITAHWTWAMTIGPQHCKIVAGDQTLFEGVLPDEKELFFTVPYSALDSDGYLNLHFFFRDAHEPGNGDSRILAVAFESFSLTVDSFS